jgi:hypothetical protein
MPCRRSPLIHLLAVGIALGGAACALHRQEPASSLIPGAVLRVTRACPPARHHEVCPRYQGTLVSIDRDTLKLVSSPDSLLQALGADDVARLERRSGRQNVILLGAALGMTAGMIIGSAATWSDCSDYTGSWACFPSGLPYGLLAGAAAGGAVGALVHPDKWSRVAWPPPH